MELPNFKNRHGERINSAFHPGKREDLLVVLGHGVTGNMDRPLMVAVAEQLSQAGWPCLRISFSGNGESEGKFEDSTVSKECEDLSDVLDQLPDGVRVAYCGHSMGGAVGLKSAADPRIEVLVSLAGMVRTALFCETEFGDQTPGSGFMWDEKDCPLSQAFVDDMKQIGDLLDEAGKLTKPYLLIHGTADDVVLPADSIDAFEAAQGPKHLLEIDGAEHSFDDESYPELVSAIDEWLSEHLESSSPR
ncbi:alpha/beta hydrolase [Haloferula chungangensis]|uniref:Alpha/beta hydrolase n=1 Tax=Haloferula chungangensis TaxID=1048331 RepID=A0ABW2L4B4_9BACT